MRLAAIIRKTLVEQLRNYWMLILTVFMAPFFVFLYYLISGNTKQHFDILVLNNDSGIEANADTSLQKAGFAEYLDEWHNDSLADPFTVITVKDRQQAIEQIRRKKADMLLVLPDGFEETLKDRYTGLDVPPEIEFLGNLRDYNYMIAAIWAGDVINRYIKEKTGMPELYTFKETGVGSSGYIDEFTAAVPGLLILSIIMLMFTASIAFVSEVENRTIIRLKLSRLTTFEFLAGIGIVQVLIGLLSVEVTLGTAVLLGFNFNGNFGYLFLVSALAAISVIAFSLIVAALTKSVNEILIVGNFPLFLFMFFTGAIFPIKSTRLFSFGGYDFGLHGLMSPSHAISALDKVLILGMPPSETWPEMVSLVAITLVYFIIGFYLYRKRHLAW